MKRNTTGDRASVWNRDASAPENRDASPADAGATVSRMKRTSRAKAPPGYPGEQERFLVSVVVPSQKMKKSDQDSTAEPAMSSVL